MVDVACLIGGSGRSGTTILKQVFLGHPQVAKVPEYRFSIDPDGLVDFYSACDRGWSPYHYDMRLKRLEALLRAVGRHRRIARIGAYMQQRYNLQKFGLPNLVPRYAGVAFERYCPDFLALVERLINSLREFSYRGQWNGSRCLVRSAMYFSGETEHNELALALGDFWRAVINSVCLHQRRQHFVEDNTWNILWFDKVRELLPQARLVHVLRDPRDVIASYTRMRWAPSDPLQAMRWYKAIIGRWFRLKPSLDRESYREVRLEDLVREPERTLREICIWWGIPWDSSLLETDLGRSHSGRWKRDFSAATGATLSAELADELREMGYERE